jgi:aminoglycoside 6'-N-acetyltransferase
MTADDSYRFRPVVEADLAMLRGWRSRPHVIRWWGPPEIEDAGESLADPRVALWIVEHRGMPFAYAQDYSPHDWSPHSFSHLPPGSRGIDQYIGEADMLDRGHGSAFVRLHCRRLFAAGAPAIGTDPDPENLRAIAAYRKAGFSVAGGPRETRWGRALLMENWSSPRSPE